MKFREHRGSLEDSLKTTVEISSKKELVKHIQKLLEPFLIEPINNETVHVKKYSGYDKRTGWDTHIVILDDYGPVGFTDALIED